MIYDAAIDTRRTLLRELENEIADLRAEKVRVEAKLERLETRRREISERADRMATLPTDLPPVLAA